MSNLRPIIILVLLCHAIWLAAQSNQFLTRSDSDPAALNLLDKMDAQLSKERLSLEFEVSVFNPGEEPIKYNGSLTQQGKMYRVSTKDVEIWCNGSLRWVYAEDAREVNLYSVDETASRGPLGLITEYTGDKYVAVISGSEQIRGVAVQSLELKPVDRNSEIAKVRLSLQPDGKPVRMEVMEKTATRTVSDIMKISIPEIRPESYFTFNKADYPGVHLEDLRID